jgi:hypothetical protein
MTFTNISLQDFNWSHGDCPIAMVTTFEHIGVSELVQLSRPVGCDPAERVVL